MSELVRVLPLLAEGGSDAVISPEFALFHPHTPHTHTNQKKARIQDPTISKCLVKTDPCQYEKEQHLRFNQRNIVRIMRESQLGNENGRGLEIGLERHLLVFVVGR